MKSSKYSSKRFQVKLMHRCEQDGSGGWSKRHANAHTDMRAVPKMMDKTIALIWLANCEPFMHVANISTREEA